MSFRLYDWVQSASEDEDVAYNAASMAPVIIPPGPTREDCLIAMLPHLAAFTEGGEVVEPAIPETRWQWRERLPNLLGGSFHQDVEDPHDVVLDEWVAGTGAGGEDHETAAVAREIGELREICPDEDCVKAAVEGLGSGQMPPEGRTYTQWMDHIAERLNAHLDEVGCQPPTGGNPAYPPHDRRSAT